MRFRRLAVIYNPAAGKLRRRPEKLERAIEALKAFGGEVVRVPTTGPRTAGMLARAEIERGADLVVACGGDGTVNEVATEIAFQDVPLAILPGGTANVLACELGIGLDLEQAALTLASAVPRRIAVGNLLHGDHERKFLLMAGIGLDAHIVYNLSLPLKDKLGKIAYWLGAAMEMGRTLEEFEVEIDGRRRSCSFALISRVRNYGGDVKIARGASLLRPEFQVVLFEGASAIHYMRYFFGVAMQSLDRVSGCSMHVATNVVVKAAADKRVYVQIDGEFAGRLPCRIDLVRDALNLMIPAGYGG